MSAAANQARNEELRKGLKILSLDAGGPRAISQLHILHHVMKKTYTGPNDDLYELEKPPCEVFDAIGGVGSGGLIAILLVILKLTATQALEVFIDLTIKVFKDVDQNPEKQTAKLKQAIQEILDQFGVNEDRKLIQEGEPTPKCKLIAPIMYKNHVGITYVLSNSATRREPPTNLTISQAMLATCATAPLFTPVVISKDFSTFEYISGEHGLSNPVREIISSAHGAFGDQATVACLLSIGCGNPGVTKSPAGTSLDSQVDFLERVALDSERAAQEIAMQMRQLTLYHRFSVKYGLEVTSFLVSKDPSDVAIHTTTYLNDLDVVDAVTRCTNALKDMDGFSTLEQLKHSGGAKIAPPPLPPLTLNYVERSLPMEFLEKALFQADGTIKSSPKLVIVTGIGGCGKTQLIRKFIDKYRNSFASAFFVDGSSEGSIRHDITRHVRSLGPGHSQDSFDDSTMFLAQPLNGSQRLLIIDNVDDPSLDLSPFIPRWENGTVLVTSRNSSRGQLSPDSHLQLDVMSLEESVELLLRASRRTASPSESHRLATAAVAEELRFLPIALVQAASYMFNTSCTETMYISRLRDNRARVLQNPATSQLDMRYRTAFAAFDASYNILPLNAQKMLHLLSFFHRQKFPIGYIDIAENDGFSTDSNNYLERGAEFDRGRDCLKDIFYSSSKWDPFEFDSIIASLLNHSLVTIVHAERTRLLHMHPLVHEWARSRLLADDIERFQDAAIRLLCCGAWEDNYIFMPYLHAHVRALAPVWNTLHANDAASFGYILSDAGMYADAAKLEERSYNLAKDRLGEDQPNVIDASESLATTYTLAGRYAEAEKLQAEILAWRTNRLGIDHPDTITASAGLAFTYNNLGRHAEVEKLEKEVLQRRTKLFGTDHPDTVNASAALAATYCTLGRYTEAEQIEKEVLKQRTHHFGIDHPDTIDACANLASTYHQLERYAEAEQLEAQVLTQRKALLGIDHPDTIRASANLAATYCQLKRYSEAENLETEVRKQRLDLLGADHPDTIRASINLATTYGLQGRYAEEEQLEAEALKQRQRLLGNNHPDTITASAHLAGTYHELGRYDEAEQIEIEVLKHRTDMWGVDHPDTIRASLSLAATYRKLGRNTELAQLETEVLKQRRNWLGFEHPETIVVTSRLAILYHQLGRYDEAEPLQKEVVKQKTRLLGAEHPSTIGASLNLAVVYSQLGRYSQAEQLETTVVQLRTKVLGDRHPDTLRAMLALTYTYGALERYSEAFALAQKALPIALETLGEEDLLSQELSEVVSCARPRRRERFKEYVKGMFS